MDSLIPTIAPLAFVDDAPFDAVTFDAYLVTSAMFDLRDWDGTTAVQANINGTTLAIVVDGAKHRLDIRLIPLPGNQVIERVTLNGRPLDRSAWNRHSDGSLVVSIAL
jgi:hypothetical protein